MGSRICDAANAKLEKIQAFSLDFTDYLIASLHLADYQKPNPHTTVRIPVKAVCLYHRGTVIYSSIQKLFGHPGASVPH